MFFTFKKPSRVAFVKKKSISSFIHAVKFNLIKININKRTKKLIGKFVTLNGVISIWYPRPISYLDTKYNSLKKYAYLLFLKFASIQTNSYTNPREAHCVLSLLEPVVMFGWPRPPMDIGAFCSWVRPHHYVACQSWYTGLSPIIDTLYRGQVIDHP